MFETYSGRLPRANNQQGSARQQSVTQTFCKESSDPEFVLPL